MLLHESGHQPIYYFPPEDVRADVLEPSDRHTHCPKKGDASYYTIRGRRDGRDAAPGTTPSRCPRRSAAAQGSDRLLLRPDGRWLEEDEEIVGHPRDPYHRIDMLSSQPAHPRLAGRRAAGREPPGRWRCSSQTCRRAGTCPREDVAADAPGQRHRHPICPYKGDRELLLGRLASGTVGKDLIWYYADPLPEVVRIAGLVCFFNEQVDIELDGELQERPESPWSHGVKSERRRRAPTRRSDARLSQDRRSRSASRWRLLDQALPGDADGGEARRQRVGVALAVALEAARSWWNSQPSSSTISRGLRKNASTS